MRDEMFISCEIVEIQVTKLCSPNTCKQVHFNTTFLYLINLFLVQSITFKLTNMLRKYSKTVELWLKRKNQCRILLHRFTCVHVFLQTRTEMVEIVNLIQVCQDAHEQKFQSWHFLFVPRSNCPTLIFTKILSNMETKRALSNE